MTGQVKHRFKREEYMWTCVWCGLQLQGGAVLKVGESKVVVVGDGPPCTLGINVKDIIEMKESLT